MSKLRLTIKISPILDTAEPEKYHAFAGKSKARSSLPDLPILYGQRNVFSDNSVVFVETDNKRGSRGAARAAKSLRWSV